MFKMIAITLVLSAALVLPLAGCGNDDEPLDPWADCGESCIGPGGGSVAIDDPDHPFYGARISVPPGAWDREWSVFMGYETTFTTPNFPDGLEGYESILTGSLDLRVTDFAPPGEQAAPPDSLYLEITFRLTDLECAPGEMFTLYRFDEAVDRWRLEFPDARTDSTITVHTYHHATQWTWGVVNVHEADWDLYLAPVMEEEHGAGDWSQVQQALQDAYDEVFDHDLGVTCTNLDFVRTVFAGIRDESQIAVVAHQDALGGACRVCDVTTGDFWNEYLDYIALNFEAWLIELFLVDNGPDLIVQIYGIIRLCETWEEIAELACDYECFWGHADSAFYSDLALYCATTMIVEAIDYAYSSGYISCPS
ncbi:MAG: hypothetical protein GY838_05130 [bacterium]|nr:hypothetical protein [bacterium]